MYATDNNDFLAEPGWQMNFDTWLTGGDYNGNNIVGAGLLTTHSAASYQADYNKQIAYFLGQTPAPRAGQLYQFIANPKLLMCPQDIPDANTYMRYELISSYVWDGAIVGFPNGPTTLIPTYKLTRFKASNILQWENDEKNTATGAWNDFSNFPIESGNLTCSQRHGRDAQVGRMDGSAARITKREMDGYALAPAGSAKNDLWYSPASTDGH